MTKLTDALKQAIIQRALVNPTQTNYRAVTVTALNSDGSCSVSLDGANINATPLYPVTLGQTAILVISPNGSFSVVPTTPGTPAADFTPPPYFTGGLCRFMASQQVVQAPGNRVLFFLDDRDLNSDWLNTPGSSRSFPVPAGASGHSPTTIINLTSIGKFSADGTRVATVFFNGVTNQWRIRVRNIGSLVQGDVATGIVPPAFFAVAKIETDILRPMSDSTALYQVVDTFIDKNGDVYWLERVFVININVIAGTVADQVFLYTVAKGDSGGSPTLVAQWNTTAWDGGPAPPGPGSWDPIQAFTIDGLVDGPNAIVAGRLTNPLGINQWINTSANVAAGNFIFPTIFGPGGPYTMQNDGEGTTFPMTNGPAILLQSSRQAVIVRNPSTSKKCTLVLFLGGEFLGALIGTQRDDIVHMFIITNIDDVDDEEITNTVSSNDVFIPGFTATGFNENCAVGQPTGGLITDFNMHVRKWAPPDNVAGPMTVDTDPTHYIVASPNEPVTGIPTGPTQLNFFKDTSSPQVQGVLTVAPGSLREIGP